MWAFKHLDRNEYSINYNADTNSNSDSNAR